MTRTFGKLLVIVLLALGSARAQDAAAPEPAPRYTVEMIIFTYAQEVATAGEIFPPDREPGESLPDDRNERATAAGVLPDPGFVRLTREQLTMNDVMGHLRRLDIYRPVMHFGWIQSVYPEAVTRPIRLASLARPAAGLDGTLQLYLSRFLHLVVDLEMTGEAGVAAGAFADTRPVRYRISEDRIFRSGELRYFDHPKFGVLARVTRADQEPATAQNELLGYPAE